MARIDSLLTEARIGLSQAPDPSIVSALQRAAGRFCRESQLWQEMLDPFQLRTGVASYELEAEARAAVEKLLVVKVNGEPLRELIRWQDIHALRTEHGAPVTAALAAGGGQLMVWRTPTATEHGLLVTVLAALAPSNTARDIPDWMAEHWHDAIVAAAQAEMYGNKAMPWYDPPKAQERDLLFAQEVARATRKQHSGGHTQMRVTPRQWI